MDFYNFYKGNCFDAYEFFGAHVTDQNTWFRTYAPAANHVAVIGEFNDWTETPMHRSYDGSTWECCIPAAQPGQTAPPAPNESRSCGPGAPQRAHSAKLGSQPASESARSR